MSGRPAAPAGGRKWSPGRAAAQDPDGPIESYFHQAKLPLASLLFVLPLVAVYEVGVRRYPGNLLLASQSIEEFFLLFGATGRMLPALAVIAILLTWHIARGDSWRVNWTTLAGMAMESIALTAPLVLLLMACGRLWFLSAPGRGPAIPMDVLRSLGAGVYEELLFRLVAFTLLHALLVDLLGMRRTAAMAVIILVPAMLFSACHYLGQEPFSYQTFAFRVLGGVYFGFIFVFRGFGITAGNHCAYDIFVMLLQDRV